MNAPARAREEKPQIPAITWPTLVLLVTAVAYIGTLQFNFVFDDVTLIAGNPAIRAWNFVPGYFLHHFWQGTNAIPGNYYRPLLLLWLRMNDALFGLHAAWWHATTVLVHLAATFLVFKLARRLGGGMFVATTAALVFGLHPTHLQVAAWVSGVSESLCAVFVLAAILVYLRDSGSRLARVSLAVALFALALLCKETAAVLPLIIAVLCWWREKALGKVMVELVPFAIVGAIYLVAREHALSGFSHARTSIPLMDVFLTAPLLVIRYLRLLVFPFHLSLFYDVAVVKSAASLAFWIPLLGLAIAGALAAWWYLRTRSRAVLLGLALLVVPLLPVLNLRLFDPGEFLQDRYLYLPSVGFAILLAFAIEKVLPDHKLRIATGGMLGMVLLGATIVQSQYWANDLVLANHALEIAPDNAKAKLNLGVELALRGRNDQAIALFKDVLLKDSSNAEAAFNLGYTYFRMGQFVNAEPPLQYSARSNPSSHNCLIYGQTEMALGKLLDSEKAFECSVALDPACEECRRKLAEARQRLR